jgi:ABC-2 type transport system permease protein
MYMGDLAAAMRREARALRQDRTTFSLLLLLPLVQLLLFGFAIAPEHQRTAIALSIVDADRAAQIEQAINSTGRFDLVATRLAPGQAEAMLRRGDVLIALEVPPLATFDDEEPQKPVRVLADMSNPAATGPALQALEASYWRRIAQAGPAGGVSALKVEIDSLYNPQRRSAWAFAPGLIGVAVMISMLLFGALAPTRDGDEAGLGTTTDMAGRAMVHMLMAVAQTALVIGLAGLFFALPLHARSLAPLMLLVPVYALAHVLLGFIIAAVSRTPMQAVQSTVAFYFPAMILSGFLYPFEAMPGWAQALGRLLPLTHFIRAARDALLKDKDAATILSHGLPMLGFAVAVLLLLLLLRQKKRPASDAGR